MRVRKSRKKLAAYERCSWLKKKKDYCSKRSATTKLNIFLDRDRRAVKARSSADL